MWSEKGGLTYVNDYIENLPGMPIGGIGTSTLEVGRNGAFQNNRLQNAWTMPLPYKPNGVAPGSWLALFSAPENGRGEGRLLQVGGLANLKGVAGISYTGCFPFVRLVYQEPSWPLKVKLEAFSPFVPHVAEDSALPIAFLTLEVENPTSLSMTAVMAMSWVNDIAAEYYFRGWVPQGNYNQIVKVNGTPAILMATRDPTLTGAAYLLAGQADGVVQWQAVANWLPPPNAARKGTEYYG